MPQPWPILSELVLTILLLKFQSVRAVTFEIINEELLEQISNGFSITILPGPLSTYLLGGILGANLGRHREIARGPDNIVFAFGGGW